MHTSHVRGDNTAVFYYPDSRVSSVYVTGSFCNWSTPGYQLYRNDKGWAVEVPNFPQGEYEYKFIVDGDWVSDSYNGNNTESGNSIITHRMNKNSIFHFDFYSPAVGENKSYVVALPPGYFLSNERYSTIYLLHGALDWEYTWIHKGLLHLTMEHLRSQGKIGEMIVVMPRENGELFRGDIRYADYIGRDLVGHIDAEFRTIPHHRHRAIDGLSTGGFSSIVLGASRPFMYSSVAGMSGAYDRRVFETIRCNAEAMRKYGQRYHISCGLGEPMCLDSSRELAEALRFEGVPVEYYENPGPHDWELWQPTVAGNLEFHWWTFQQN